MRDKVLQRVRETCELYEREMNHIAMIMIVDEWNIQSCTDRDCMSECGMRGVDIV